MIAYLACSENARVAAKAMKTPVEKENKTETKSGNAKNTSRWYQKQVLIGSFAVKFDKQYWELQKFFFENLLSRSAVSRNVWQLWRHNVKIRPSRAWKEWRHSHSSRSLGSAFPRQVLKELCTIFNLPV